MAKRTKLMLGEQETSKDLSGHVYIVTGANSGVGLETTRQLISQGAKVVMACRRVEAAEEVAREFDGLAGSYDILRIDLADLASVRTFAAAFIENYHRLDGLVCNAGMVNMSGGLTRTKDGLETTIGISYFGHFLLTELLVDRLTETKGSRVVLLSSVVHAGRPGNRPAVDLDDLNYERRAYDNFAVYAEAKVAMNLYALELAERLDASGVTVVAVHPGWARSNFGSGGSLPMRMLMGAMRPFTRSMTDSNVESAQTSLHCLLSDDVPNHSGEYYSQSSVLYRDSECKQGGWPLESPNPNARDMGVARELVARSYDIVGLARP